MSQQLNGPADAQNKTDEKRQRFLSRKALQNAIETKRKELDAKAKILQNIYDAVTTTSGRETFKDDRPQALCSATKNYKEALNQLAELYQMDQWGDYKDEAKLTREYSRLGHAHHAIEQAASSPVHEAMSQTSRRSCRSSVSRTSSASSAKRKALAEVAVAKKQAEYDRIIAEKESTRRIKEADQQRQREQQQAQHEYEMAKLAADKAEAIADARLQAIEEALREEDEELQLDLPDIQDQLAPFERVRAWMGAQVNVPTTPLARQAPPNRGLITTPLVHQVPLNHGPITTSTPKQENTFGLLETFTATNQRLISGLTKQCLPKCHPDVFDGEVTLFHPWRRSFKAMVEDVEVSPSQEINYLRNFTTGRAQEVVNNFRRRQHEEPATALRDLWKELERRFGNAAAITNNLLERLTETAQFSDKDSGELQTFADLCADVDSQIKHLPGLSCLNYPNVIRPVIEKLPSYLRTKWEKEIVQYADDHEEAYPDFHVFASMIQRQARTRNHPNVLASGVLNLNLPRRREEKAQKRATRPEPENRRVLKIDATSSDEKLCAFHQRKGHTLTECRSFNSKPVGERTDWILKAGLCFRCLEGKHIARECKAVIRCDTCGSDRHMAILHRDQGEELEINFTAIQEEKGEEVSTSCTTICKDRKGGLSCSKIVLVDISHQQHPKETHRIYAIIDDQSNASLISTELANKLQADGPIEK